MVNETMNTKCIIGRGLVGIYERVNLLFTKFSVDLHGYCRIFRGFSPLGNNPLWGPVVNGPIVYDRPDYDRLALPKRTYHRNSGIGRGTRF